jgi:hypothetical protein
MADAELLAAAGHELSERFHNCKVLLTQPATPAKGSAIFFHAAYLFDLNSVRRIAECGSAAWDYHRLKNYNRACSIEGFIAVHPS